MVGNSMLTLLIELFTSFAKIGLFTFGGGYAMISLIEDICVNKNIWITHDEMMDVTVIAESTPGPIAVNCATFVGYKKAGIIGAIVSTVGIVLPSFCVIFIISMFLDNFLEIEIVAKAFKGIQIAVGILILKAAISMITKMKKRALPIIILIVSCGIILLSNLCSFSISSIAIMIVAGVANLIAAIINKKGEI